MEQAQQMINVTEAVFFATVGPLNVHPRPTRGGRSFWEHLDYPPLNNVIGISTARYSDEGETWRVRADVPGDRPTGF